MGRPLQLVKCATDGQLEVGQEAADVLRAVRGPVAVVAVCGRARQGKSFILNQIAAAWNPKDTEGADRSSSGFVVAPTHRPCTKGIWLWSKPIPRTSIDGKPFHIILLDTEGIDAYDQTGQYSTQIFSLAVLLSSLFVYNQMGGIDEAALDRLSLVTEMTKHIRVRSSSGQERTEASELGACSPHFLWLLRDFFLSLREENGQEITAGDYLETALRPVQARGAASAAKNQIRESIRELFPARDCFTLVRPMNDEAKLQSLGEVPASELRPEFRSGLARLLDRMLQRALPKRLGATMLTGPMLAGLTAMYVETINKGAVPVIATAWQGVAEAECRRGLDEAQAVYMENLDETVPAEEEALSAMQQSAMAKALEAFRAVAVGDAQMKEKFESQLQSFASVRFKQHRATALSKAEMHIMQMLQVTAANMRRAAEAADATVPTLIKALVTEISTYADTPGGPFKWEKVVEYLVREGCSTVGECATRREASAAKKADDLTASLQASMAESKALAADLEQSRAAVGQYEVKLARSEEQYRAATESVRRLQAELEQRKRAASDASDTLTEVRNTAAKSATEVVMLREEGAGLRAEVAALRTETTRARAECGELQSQLSSKTNSESDLHHRLRAAMMESKRESETHAQMLETVKKALAARDSQVASLKEENKTINENLSELQRQADELAADQAAAATATRRLKDELAETRDNEARLKTSVANLEAMLGEQDDSRAEHEQLRREKSQGEQSLWEANQREAALVQREKDLKNEVASLMRQLKELKKDKQAELVEMEKREMSLRTQLQEVPQGSLLLSNPLMAHRRAPALQRQAGAPLQRENNDEDAVTEAAEAGAGDEEEFHDAETEYTVGLHEPGSADVEGSSSTQRGKRRRDNDAHPLPAAQHEGTAGQDEPPAKTTRRNTRKGASVPTSSSPANSMTVQALKAALTNAGHGSEVWTVRPGTKAQFVAMYDRLM